MKLLSCGNGVQSKSWKVEESKPAGLCRAYYIDGGEAWYDDEYGTQILKRGWLYFFPSVKPYSIHHNPDDPVTCLWWWMDSFPVAISELIGIEVKEGSSLGSLVRSIQRCFAAEGIKQSFLPSMVEAMTSYCQEHDWLPRSNEKFAEILSFMDAHFSEEISIEEISRHFHYSPEHFIRLFQRELNLTPYQYLIQRRMRQAARMLLGEMPVKEVAVMVGYRNAKVFAYRFKQIFGVAPSKYKHFYHPEA